MLQRKVNFTIPSLLSCGVTQISPGGLSHSFPWLLGVENRWLWAEFLSLNPCNATSLNEATLPKVTPFLEAAHLQWWLVTGCNGPRLLSSTRNNSRAIPAPELPMASAQAFLATTLLCNLFLAWSYMLPSSQVLIMRDLFNQLPAHQSQTLEIQPQTPSQDGAQQQGCPALSKS